MTATGIDTITSEAGVARKSLYNNFASKQELMLTYIQARHDEWLELYRVRLDEASSPQEQVVAVFDAYLDHARLMDALGFRGCGLLNAAAELPVGSLGRETVRQHKEHVESILSEHLTAAGYSKPAEIAEHLSFLLEGSMIRAGLECNLDRLAHARELAITLLDIQ